LIVHKNKPYTHICVFSPLGEDSTEYSDCIDCEMITDVRDANFDRNDRNLFIVEDCDTKSMNKEQRSIISNFFRFECSHNQVDCIVICQNMFDNLPIVRRVCNICFVFPCHDIQYLHSLSKLFNIPLPDLKHIFKYIITDKYDSLCIDETRPSVRLRKNIFDAIKI